MVGAPATRGEWDNTADAIACCTTITNDTGGAGEGSKDAASHSRESHHAAGSHLTRTRLTPDSHPSPSLRPHPRRRGGSRRRDLGSIGRVSARAGRTACTARTALSARQRPEATGAVGFPESTSHTGGPGCAPARPVGPLGLNRSVRRSRRQALKALRIPANPMGHPPLRTQAAPLPPPRLCSRLRFRDCAPDRKAASALCAQRNARHNHLYNT